MEYSHANQDCFAKLANVADKLWQSKILFLQTKGTVLVCGLRLRLESATPQHQRRPPREVGGIAKRIKTTRLRRKTKPSRDVILHVRPEL